MDNADLEKLRVAPGKLLPKFKASVTSYSVTVASSVSELKLTVLTSDSGASYTIKGTAKGDKVLKLGEGEKVEVEIVVCAEDAKTIKTYTIAAQRLSADDATLSSLALSGGSLSPPFSPFIYSYECYLFSSTEEVSLTAKTEDEAMKLSMGDGSPVGTVSLNPGRTLAQLNVLSVNGKGTTKYAITFIKPRLPITLRLKKKDEKFECAVCCGVLDKPSCIKGGPYHYCQYCLEELTRTNKVDPFTGKNLEEGWMEQDQETDAQLGELEALCQLPSTIVEAKMKQIGAKLKAERLKSQKEESTEACKECSKKIPVTDLPVHKELLCTAKNSSLAPKKQEVKVKSWEKRLRDESLGNQAGELAMKGLNWEDKYTEALPSPGEAPHYAPDQAPVDHLLKAARCYATAISSSPRETQHHLALGLVLEEFFYAEDLFGMTLEETGGEMEGDAEISSKEEEFSAICKLHGVDGSAPLAIQLKAAEAEYQSLKDAGQAHKAEHVQGLYAWKSKKALQASQGSYAVDTESSLYRAKLKYQDAVSCSPSDGVACYHLGRVCLLLGERDEAKECLIAAVAFKPTLSPARFCLGLVLSASHVAHAKSLMVHGLSQHLEQTQLVHETKAEPLRDAVEELHSKVFYRSSNTMIVDGFLCLASLSGHAHLSPKVCLLSSTCCVAVAHLHHRASTYERFLWASLKARALLLQLLHKDKDPSVLRHCRQLSALISCSGLKPSPELREMQLEVFELGVLLQPSSSEALCHLGNGQLMQYDATNEAGWLADAELSFRSSIEVEGKAITTSSIPDKLKEEGWWKKKHAKPSAPVPVATSGTPAGKKVGGPPASTKQGPPARGGKSLPSSTAPPASKPGGAAAARRGPSTNTSRATGAARKPDVASGGSKVPPRGGPATQKSTGARGLAGKTVATLGELKAGGASEAKKQPPVQQAAVPAKQSSNTTTSSNSSSGTESDKKAPPSSDKSGKVEMNPCTHHARLGLARALFKTDDKKRLEEAENLYQEVIKMSPDVHDAYIELGDMLSKINPTRAVGVYSRFPFSNPPSFDDAFLHGEIVRLVMKSEDYDNPQLSRSMIAMGKALGIGVIDKQVAILEGKFKSAVLKTVYAGIHGKPLDDPELQAFFKFRCWL